MKGVRGLALAAFLGLLAVVLNWVYLQSKTRGAGAISFLAIKSGVAIEPGETLSEQHFAEVRIPEIHARGLKDAVYLYKDASTVAGTRATRRYEAGDLVFRRDYRTPPAELKLGPNERLLWVSVDSRAFVPEMVDPGDQITFLLPRLPAFPGSAIGGADLDDSADSAAASILNPADDAGPDTQAEPTPVSEGVEMIGPFRVASLGTRLGSRQVQSATRSAASQERQVGVIVRAEGGVLEPNAVKLLERLQRSDYRHVGVALHPRAEAE
jgi:hypothetical protein